MDTSFQETAKVIVDEGLEREFTAKSPRDTRIPVVPDIVSVCIGVRRCGKSTLMESVILKLLSDGVPRENIVCINFADERLLPLQSGGWDALYTAYYGRYPEKRKRETVYFFFDEIQLYPRWELFVERLRREENCRVFITGSSSHLLSQEIATELRGRSLSCELFPFSFGEYLTRAGVKRGGRGAARRLAQMKAWDDFKAQGGFPALYGQPEDTRKLIHREYHNALMLHDVIERNRVSQPLAMRHLVNRLLNGIGTVFSFRKMGEELKALGFPITRATVAQYLQWLEDAYFIFTVNVYSASVARQARELRKVYCVDHALADTLSNGVLRNRGQMLENIVFVQLRRQTERVFYYKSKGGFEVDFMAVLPDGEKRLVQVCADISSPATRKRELRALRSAMEETGLQEAWLVTEWENETVELPCGTVHVVPAADYLAQS
ncbi:MAG: ATP-binding protein [Akkermansia sp.]|nr:ATP-binding protein [Akkermansia sp.]